MAAPSATELRRMPVPIPSVSAEICTATGMGPIDPKLTVATVCSRWKLHAQRLRYDYFGSPMLRRNPLNGVSPKHFETGSTFAKTQLGWRTRASHSNASSISPR